MSVVRVIKKFTKILTRKQKIRAVELAVLMLIGGLLEICSVSLIIPFINLVMNPETIMQKWYAILICSTFGIDTSHGFLVFVSVCLTGIYIVKNIYLVFEYNIQYKYVYNNMYDMQSRLMDNYIHKPYEFFLGANTGEIIRIINTDTQSAFELLAMLLGLLTETIVSVMLIVAIFVISPWVVLGMALILGLVMIAINKITKPILRRAGERNLRSLTGRNQWLLQAIQGIKDIKVTSKEKFFQDNYGNCGLEYVQSLRQNRIMSIVPRFAIEGISMGSFFIVICVMLLVGQDKDVIIPIISAIAMAAIRLLPSVNRISSSLANISYNEPMLDKLIENINASERDDSSKKANNKGSNKEIILSDELKLDNVTFHYPASDTNIFCNATFEIKRGESIGIVGSSGAGKSTLVDIILGLLIPQKGQVTVDGIGVNNDLAAWYKMVGYIPQTIFMLDGTIRENIAFGEDKDCISDERLQKAISEAALTDFINDLPDGLDTMIGERGIRISGGQRQRIGIARSLYRDPAILIFDEATSALDNETESNIMEAINRLQGNKTMIIIAHRLTTIENCDHVYEVKCGTITKVR